jgi:hypothetical protein
VIPIYMGGLDRYMARANDLAAGGYAAYTIR